MSKRRITFSFRLPPYLSPRNDWRKRIHKLALEAVQTRNITLLESDQLQIDVALYLEKSALKFHDVDNRLKDIMDAYKEGQEEQKENRYWNQSSQTTTRFIELLLRRPLHKNRAKVMDM